MFKVQVFIVARSDTESVSGSSEIVIEIPFDRLLNVNNSAFQRNGELKSNRQ